MQAFNKADRSNAVVTELFGQDCFALSFLEFDGQSRLSV